MKKKLNFQLTLVQTMLEHGFPLCKKSYQEALLEADKESVMSIKDNKSVIDDSHSHSPISPRKRVLKSIGSSKKSLKMSDSDSNSSTGKWKNIEAKQRKIIEKRQRSKKPKYVVLPVKKKKLKGRQNTVQDFTF